MEKINSQTALIFFFLVVSFLILSCFTAHIHEVQAAGVYHIVKKNETVWGIAHAYGVSIPDLLKINKIEDINSLKVDSVLFIPSASRVIENTAANAEIKDYDDSIKSEDNRSKKSVKKKNSDKRNGVTCTTTPPEEKITTKKVKFIWPVRGTVKTRFGIQPNKTYNNWIKIVSVTGTKVKAAASGTVIFSSELKNYGETIIIRHKDNFATVYTHLKKRYVQIDQNVRKGEAIALMAEKDDAGEAYINFEIRYKGKAHNPLSFLP